MMQTLHMLLCGVFNPTTTRLSERSTKQTTGLSQIINILTRDSGILDWCLTNRPKLFSPVVQLPKIGRSDHFVVMISPCDVPPSAKERSKKVINKRDLRPSRLRDFGNWITQQRWEGVLSLTDVSDKYEFFMKLMLEAVEKYLPVRKITICNSDKPWVSSKFKQLVARRQRALGHLGKDSPQFKHLRNAVLEECRYCKRVFYNSKVAKLKETNPRRWWKEVKGLTGVDSSMDWPLRMLCSDTPTVDVLAEKFSLFLEDLTDHFFPLTPSTPGHHYSVPSDLLVNEHQAYVALRQIKCNKSSGPDPIPTIIWKCFAFELAPVVCDLYNASMTQGYVPEPLKRSVISPIPKCPYPKAVDEDLRPISLTSQLAKVLEGFTLRSLFKDVSSKLDHLQFAVAGKSTTEALIFVLHVILEALDKGDCLARLFFSDFSKGFDLVDRNVLLDELSNLEVSEPIIRWIAAFISNRQQFVKIGDVCSQVVTPQGGIPQGTKLAPLLFAILVNRLSYNWNNRIKYVDDATVFEIIPRNSPSYLPIIAADINHYAQARNMRLNAKKCKEMMISYLEYNSLTFQPLFLNGSLIERVDTYKLLGVHISKDLTWNNHCEAIASKASKRIFAIRTLKKSGLSSYDLVNVYCSIVRPVLEYASPVWAAIPDYLSDLVESIQKKVLGIIFPNLTYNEALDASGLVSLRQRRGDMCARVIHKAKLGGPLLRLIPKPTVTSHGYNLRSGEKTVCQPQGKTKRLNDFMTYKYH